MPTGKPDKPQEETLSIVSTGIAKPGRKVDQSDDFWERFESRTLGQSEFHFSRAPRSHLLFFHIFRKGAARLRDHFYASNKRCEVALIKIESDYANLREIKSEVSFDWCGVALACSNDFADNYEGLCALVAKDVSEATAGFRPNDSTELVSNASPNLKATYALLLDDEVSARFYCYLGREVVQSLNEYWHPHAKSEAAPLFESEVFASPFEFNSRVNPLDIFRQRIIAEGDQQLFAGLIARGPTDEDVPEGTVAERLARIDEYARQHPFKTVSQCVLDLFGKELGSVEEVVSANNGVSEKLLPGKAPEEWSQRNGKENPIEFIKRVYAPWFVDGGEIPRAHIKKIDEPLYLALATHISRHGEPTDIRLPKHRALIDQLQNPPSEAEISRMRTILRTHDLRKSGAKNER